MNILPDLARHLSTILSTIAEEYALALKDTDLRGVQLPYLLAICRHPGMTQDALAGILGVDKSNVARQFAALEQLGYITREHEGINRRRRILRPTDRAFDLLPRLIEIQTDCQETLTRSLSSEEVELFCELCERMAHSAERMTATRRAHQNSASEAEISTEDPD